MRSDRDRAATCPPNSPPPTAVGTLSRSRDGRARLDAVGAALACACACHCVALALLGAAVPVLGGQLGDRVEEALFDITAAIGAVSLVRHAARVRERICARVVLPLLGALALLLVARLVASRGWGGAAEVSGALAAGMMAAAHLTAMRRSRPANATPGTRGRGDACRACGDPDPSPGAPSPRSRD